MDHGLDDVIGGHRRNLQSVAQLVDCLVMCALVAVRRGQIFCELRSNRVETGINKWITAGAAVRVGVLQMLDQAAAQGNVEQLQATADTKQWRLGGDGMLDGSDLVPVGGHLVISAAGVGRSASVKRWLDIFAAHDDHRVRSINDLQHLLDAEIIAGNQRGVVPGIDDLTDGVFVELIKFQLELRVVRTGLANVQNREI